MPIVNADKAAKQVTPMTKLRHKLDRTGLLSVVSIFMIVDFDKIG